MPTVYFMGYVEPRNLQLLIENLAPVTEKDMLTGHVVTFTVAIVECVISVECEVDEYLHSYVSNLYTRSYEMVRTLVNLISLRHAWGLTVHLDTFIDPDGNEETLMNRMDKLAGIFDAYELSTVDHMFDFMVSNVNLFMAVDDLVSAISTPRIVAVNCSRAIDALRNLLAPDIPEKTGWRILRETLNVDEDYLKWISDKSKSSRHGHHIILPDHIAEEVLRRTWSVLNRYLHFKTRYQQPLPLSNFPQLSSPPTTQP